MTLTTPIHTNPADAMNITNRQTFVSPRRKAPPSLPLSLQPSSKFSDEFDGLLSPPPSAGLKRVVAPRPLVLQPTPRFSKEFDGLPSPPHTAGLKRRSHIRRKERPQRISQAMHVPPPIIITKTAESYQNLQQPTPLCSTDQTPSPPPRNPRRPSSSRIYQPPLSAPIHHQQHGTAHASPRSPPLSAPIQPQQHVGSRYREDFLPAPDAIKVPPLFIPNSFRQESREPTDFTPPGSSNSSPADHVHESPDQMDFEGLGAPSSSPPSSMPIYLQESLDRAHLITELATPDTPTASLPAPVYPRDLENPDSPGSIYSTLSPEEPSTVEWDTMGSFNAEALECTEDLISRLDHWLVVPEDEGPALTRQNTEKIVDLLRLRRQRAGLE